MAVVATAGHVDHGKSTLVRLLTGTEPDRWAEERDRGLTIDLGYAWTDLDGVHLSLVDVPGHERFAANMLAGLGAVAGVMFVVAADEGWARQSEEHARAVAALGLREVLLVVTRCDLVDESRALRSARAAVEHLAALGLAAREFVLVSGRTGAGLPGLREALRRLAVAVGDADPEAPVRLWLDRAFTVRGVGTVVTGTLTAGTVQVEDELLLRGEVVRVRGVQTSDRPVDRVAAPARVALNLRAVPLDGVARGDVLLDPRLPGPAAVVDVTTYEPWPRGAIPRSWPRQLVLHVGTAAVGVHVHAMADGRLRLRPATALPLALGDRGVLRDPGLHEVRAGVEVVALDPPRRRQRPTVTRQGAADEPGTAPTNGDDGPLATLGSWLAVHPLDPPTREQLGSWGVTAHVLAGAERAGQVTRLCGLVLAGDAVARATDAIQGLAEPFRPGDAAAALQTSRRVVIALLERLDSLMVTRRLPDGTRVVR
ncbi:selenocysteine-specific translation elongation factor [Phycicoccus sp. Root101]|uniref:selenocysteine-specific translation elongation factor n=1 Tax=Phycicoccus sp. Root101 TaxID=1736421 RepID=UPI000702E2B1|nr:selenocysteine-specific translation elongation factor [Phycicoccus sp. Root101]KQU68243.1 hypothetical protein ASC58_11870 [Phycicoccus sp. Root101]